jgi:hypothetical protein
LAGANKTPNIAPAAAPAATAVIILPVLFIKNVLEGN